MVGLTRSSKLDRGSYIISIVKTASKKIRAWIHSMKFFSPEFAWNTVVSMEYCCHVWAGACSCYFELLFKLQKQICRTVGLSLGSLSKWSQLKSVIIITSVDAQQNCLNWFHFFFLEGGLIVILINCKFFCHHACLDVTKMSMSAVSFLA